MVRRRLKIDKSTSESDENTCDVKNCKEAKDRSLPYKKVKETVPSIKWRSSLGKPKRVQVCRTHYREYRKATKEARQLDRLGRG